MKLSEFSKLKVNDWVMIEALCYGLSHTQETELKGQTGPWLVQIKSLGPTFFEYEHFLKKESNASSSARGYATKRQVICRIHDRDAGIIK